MIRRREPGSSSGARRRLGQEQPQEPARIPRPNLRVSEGGGRPARQERRQRTVWINSPEAAHITQSLLEWRKQKTIADELRRTARINPNAHKEPLFDESEPLLETVGDFLRQYHKDLDQMLQDAGDEFTITDVEPSIQHRFSERETADVIGMLKTVDLGSEGPATEGSLPRMVEQAISDLEGSQEAARKEWEYDRLARAVDSANERSRELRAERYDMRNEYMEHEFGAVPPEYSELEPSDSLRREDLLKHYDLVEPDDSYMIEGVDTRRVVGIFISLPEDLSSGRGETRLYHRFTSQELEQIKGSSESRPVVLGVAARGDNKISLTRFDLEHGTAARIASNHVELFTENDGTLTVDCPGGEGNGVSLVMERATKEDEESENTRNRRYCPKCGETYSHHIDFCFNEGEPLREMEDEGSDEVAGSVETAVEAEEQPEWSRWETNPDALAAFAEIQGVSERDLRTAERAVASILAVGDAGVPNDAIELVQFLQSGQEGARPTHAQVRQAIAKLREHQILKRLSSRDTQIVRTRLYLEKIINIMERSVNVEMDRARPSLAKVRQWEALAKRGPAGIRQLRERLAGMRSLAYYIDEQDDPARMRIPDFRIITGDNGLRDELVKADMRYQDTSIETDRRKVMEAVRRWLGHAEATIAELVRQSER